MVQLLPAVALIAIGFQTPPAVKLSQHGTVTQQVAATTITVDYNRPVARGRDLFGALVPYDRVWCPGADDCTTLTVSTDITIDDLTAAAKGHDMEVEEAADNIHNAAREMKQAGKIS